MSIFALLRHSGKGSFFSLPDRYIRYIRSHYSFIDHFVVSSNEIDNIIACECIDFGANLSDHIPVTVIIKCTSAANDTSKSPSLDGISYMVMHTTILPEKVSRPLMPTGTLMVCIKLLSSVCNPPQRLTYLKQLVIIISSSTMITYQISRPSLLMRIVYGSRMVVLVSV